jgi:hypothetical protein
MNRYMVAIKDIEIYMVEVEAETEGDALKIAESEMEENGKDGYHHDSDNDYAVYDN